MTCDTNSCDICDGFSDVCARRAQIRQRKICTQSQPANDGHWGGILSFSTFKDVSASDHKVYSFRPWWLITGRSTDLPKLNFFMFYSKLQKIKLFYHSLVGCLSKGIEGTFSKITFFFLSCFIRLGEKSQKLLKNHDFKNSHFKSGFWDFSPNG